MAFGARKSSEFSACNFPNASDSLLVLRRARRRLRELLLLSSPACALLFPGSALLLAGRALLLGGGAARAGSARSSGSGAG